jgi:hypothetical protein
MASGMSFRFLRHRVLSDRFGSAQDHVAEPVVGGGREMAAPREQASAPRVHHVGRFRWAFVALLALAAASLVAAVVLSSSTSRTTATAGNWSVWSPADGGLAGAQEIADYVAPYYRATPADQLAVVTAVNLNNASNPLQVAVPVSGSAGGGLVPLPASSTILYNLCGVNSADCSIGVGTPSSDRLLLLRREALELALYTFKYLSGIQSVVAILPPGHTVQACTGICAKPAQKPVIKPLDIAIAFDRAELAPWLSHPLRTTLPEQLPPTVSQMANAPEAELVSVITAHGLFAEQSEQSQAGSTVIALSPLPPQ